MGDGEDHVKIATGQKFIPSLFQPFFLCHRLAFRAVPVPAGIVTVPEVAALIADFLVTSGNAGTVY